MPCEAKKLSIRELIIEVTSPPSFVGTPAEVAGRIIEAVDLEAADGFILVPHVTPGGLDEFADTVVPILQEAGRFRHDYEGTTLRDHLGLGPARTSSRGLEDGFGVTGDHVPLGILDLVPVVSGSDPKRALCNALDLVQVAEQLGYRRYWFAEHHLNAGVAGSAPALLIAMVGAHTEHIRLGSGGVQSGHRTALSVVEGFGLLDAMYPGRIDLGIGRSGGRTFFKEKLARSEGRTASSEKSLRQDRYADNGLLIPAAPSLRHLAAAPRISLTAQMLQQEQAKSAEYGDLVEDILGYVGRVVPFQGRLGSTSGSRRRSAGGAVDPGFEPGERSGGRPTRPPVRCQLPHQPGHRPECCACLPRGLRPIASSSVPTWRSRLMWSWVPMTKRRRIWLLAMRIGYEAFAVARVQSRSRIQRKRGDTPGLPKTRPWLTIVWRASSSARLRRWSRDSSVSKKLFRLTKSS